MTARQQAMTGNTVNPDVFKRRTGIDEEAFLILRESPLFSGMEPGPIREAVADSYIQRFTKDTPIFFHGEPANRFFILLSGWVKVYRDTADGHESVIGVFTRGESFAEAAVAKQATYPANATVVEEARMLTIPADRFMRHVKKNPILAMNLMTDMSNRMRGLVRQVEQLSARSSAERLAGFLLQLCKSQNGKAVVSLPLDKSLIAARLGMQPETLSRSLAKLRRIGIETRGSQVHIMDVHALREFSDGEGRP